jgi:hypothetical protein
MQVLFIKNQHAMKIINFLLTLTLIFFVINSPILANEDAEKVAFVIDNAQSSMSIQGGSNVRSWDADVTEINALISAEVAALLTLDAERNGVLSLSEFRVPVKKISSNNNTLTRNIHKYLKESDHPAIFFSLGEATVKPSSNGNSNEFEVTTIGVINAAGADKEVVFNINGTVKEDGTIILAGVSEMAFSDFNLDRPSAMLGTVRANDEIEVHFNLVLVRK